jgi:hypothetical protein
MFALFNSVTANFLSDSLCLDRQLWELSSQLTENTVCLFYNGQSQEYT